jgi:protein-L-isoaspartate(D-aspartate) O-methyltransferase
MSYDFAAARDNMVENEVRANDVTDKRLIAAMRGVARERFVSEGSQALAYAGAVVPVGEGHHLLDPRSFAKLAQAAELTGSERLLDVGCATGYSAAVFARLAREVFALESNEAFGKAAARALSDLANVRVFQGDLRKGVPAHGPYDVIFIEGAVEELPEALTRQLKPGGRILAIVASGAAGGGRIYQRTGESLSARNLFDARVPPLPGFQRMPIFVF